MKRQLMTRAVVATAFLALVGLIAIEFAFTRGRATQGGPTVLSVEEALVQLRTQQATVATPAAPVPPPPLAQARARYALSVQALDAAWTALTPALSVQLNRPQRVWIWRRNTDCETAAGGDDDSSRESQRLACRGAANLARAAWLKQQAASPPTSALAVESAPATPAELALAPNAACGWLRDRSAHLGQTISFQGEYQNDHSGPALVRPIGCDQAIVLREMDPAARMMLERADPPPWSSQPRRLVALFTGRLVQSGFGADDDAIRMHVAEVTNVQVVGAR